MSNVSETDKFIVRTVNTGPMGPQGPVKKNVTIMNNESGIKYPARRYNLMNFMTTEEMTNTDLSDELLAGIPNDKMPETDDDTTESSSTTGDDTTSSTSQSTISGDDTTSSTSQSTISGGGGAIIDGDDEVDDDI